MCHILHSKCALISITMLAIIVLSSCGQPQGNASLAPTLESENQPAPSPVALAPEAPGVFVYQATQEDPTMLYLADTTLESIRPFPGLSNGGACPAFSPDGSQLAFCTNQDGQDALFIVDGEGGEPQRLAEQLSGCGCGPDAPLSWSPDGRWISLPVSADKSQPVYDLYVVNVEDSQATNLTDSPQRFGGLAWDPDSRSILFSGTMDGKADIYRMDIDSKTLTPLAISPIAGSATDWSPDGSKLLYFADSGGGNFDVYVLPAGSDQAQRLTEAGGFDSYPRWFPDGKSILFVSTRDGDNEIYRMNADGTEQTNLTRNPGVMDIWPVLSLDGREIIYLTNADNQWDSWIMNADGSNKRKVTDLIGIPATIAWKP
jgi:Tol biopolymer transport system component